MWGLEKYIFQEFPNAWYSEVLYVQGVVISGNTVAQENYADHGATYILITGIILSFPSALATSITFTDAFNRILFVMAADPGGNGFLPVQQLIKGESFQIIANNNTDGFNFSVQHQYMRNTDVPGHN